MLPFRMSCFVLSNLIVTAGMLTPGLGVWIQLSYFPSLGSLVAVCVTATILPWSLVLVLALF